MEANIAFAPEAEHNPLAVWVAETLRERLRRDPRRRRDFVGLRAAVVLVAKDRRLSVTLRFDHGFLTVHDGMMGIPDVTFCGDYEALTELAKLRALLRIHGQLAPEQREQMMAIRREHHGHHEMLLEDCEGDLEKLCPDADSPFDHMECLHEHADHVSEECTSALETLRHKRGFRRGPFRH